MTADKWFKFQVANCQMEKTIDEEFSFTTPLEANTKIVHHICTTNSRNL